MVERGGKREGRRTNRGGWVKKAIRRGERDAQIENKLLQR